MHIKKMGSGGPRLPCFHILEKPIPPKGIIPFLNISRRKPSLLLLVAGPSWVIAPEAKARMKPTFPFTKLPRKLVKFSFFSSFSASFGE